MQFSLSRHARAPFMCVRTFREIPSISLSVEEEKGEENPAEYDSVG